MHNKIVNKIKAIRLDKGISTATMAEKLNIDPSAYTRLECAKTLTWAKYIEDILKIFEMPYEEFFKDPDPNTTVYNEKGSILGNQGKVENLHTEKKELTDKINQLHEARLDDKDAIITEKNITIDNQKIIIDNLKDIIAVLKTKS